MADHPPASDLMHSLAVMHTEQTGRHDRELRSFFAGAAAALALVEQDTSSMDNGSSPRRH